jgi:hypothetical protein
VIDGGTEGCRRALLERNDRIGGGRRIVRPDAIRISCTARVFGGSTYTVIPERALKNRTGVQVDIEVVWRVAVRLRDGPVPTADREEGEIQINALVRRETRQGQRCGRIGVPVEKSCQSCAPSITLSPLTPVE